MEHDFIIIENAPLGKARKENWNGREFLVAPVTMIVPGTLNGTAGPIFYPTEENAKSTHAWNGMPIVVTHPTKDGKPVSARHPKILQHTGIGGVYEVTNDSGKLQAEAWIDVLDADRVDPRIVKNIKAGKPIEVSTGLSFGKVTKAPEGSKDDKGRAYNYIVGDYKPDHLAILPDATGACSIQDGCGVLMNSSITDRLLHFKDYLGSIFRWLTFQGYASKPIQEIAVNYEKSYGEKRNSLDKQIMERYGRMPTTFTDGVYPYLVDMYDGYVIFRNDGKYYKVGYSEAESKCTLNEEEPTEVERVTVYEPVENSGDDEDHNVTKYEEWFELEKEEVADNIIRKLPNGKYRLYSKKGKNLGTFDSLDAAKKHEGEVEYFKKADNQVGELANNVEVSMDRAAMLSWLTTNCDCWKSPEDKEILNKMTDAKLKQLKDAAERGKAAESMLVSVANAAGLDKEKPVTVEAFKEKFKPAEPPPVAQPIGAPARSLKEWEDSMPPEARKIWNSAKQVEQRERDTLIANIVFKLDGVERQQMIEYLQNKEIPELKLIQSLRGPAPVNEMQLNTPLYLGGVGGPTQNRYLDQSQKDDVLELPGLYDYDEEVA